MITSIRLATGVYCLGVLVLGVVTFVFSCALTSPAPPDRNRRGSLVEEFTRGEQLKPFHEASYRRLKAKRQVAEEVIVRRRSLAEAIEVFRALDQEWPENRPWPAAPADREMSEDEWYGWAVIHQVRQVLTDRPAAATVVPGQLEKELQELLAGQKNHRPAPADARTKRGR